MSDLDLPMFPAWGVGDTRELDENQLDRLLDQDCYDSYDQTYLIDGTRWKVTHETHRPDGRCVYVMECIAVGADGGA